MLLADVDERHVILPATDPKYGDDLRRLLALTRPDFLHVQNDAEVAAVSSLRHALDQAGVKLYLPAAKTVEICLNKYETYRRWHAAGVRVPRTILIREPADLHQAFHELGDTLWIRAVTGAAGAGALPTNNYELAKCWIDRHRGWGRFTAAQLLTKESAAWLSLWFEGELVVAQSRRRRAWNFGDRTLSGVTGITGVAETMADPVVDRVALDAITAIDPRPHGIFGVDITYDQQGWPNPTEINIGRFFTTVYFFTKAGLNLPEIYCNIALEDVFPVLERKINPLPEGLVWIRGMDVEPVLSTTSELALVAQRERIEALAS